MNTPPSDPFLDLAEQHIARLNQHRQRPWYHQSLQILKAVRLALSLPICEALLRGERVPRNMLDPVWRRAYGL